jgi:arabinogalactan endo-1,4-beta-galactosidase
VDRVHERLSGPATRHILQREYEQYGNPQYGEDQRGASVQPARQRALPQPGRSVRTDAVDGDRHWRATQTRSAGPPGLEIFKDYGYNWIRVRLSHTPTDLPNNIEYTIALAKDAKKLGYRFLLDYHYSDTWADPGKQFLPKAWEGLSHAQLVKAVFEYTKQTMSAFRQAGVLPDMVQIGNEVINGMLWPDGRLPENWDNFADLVKAGIAGAGAGTGDAARPRIMIHIDRGGDKARTKYFFDELNSFCAKTWLSWRWSN